MSSKSIVNTDNDIDFIFRVNLKNPAFCFISSKSIVNTWCQTTPYEKWLNAQKPTYSNNKIRTIKDHRQKAIQYISLLQSKAGEGAQCRKCQPCSCQPTIITLIWSLLVHWCSDSVYYSINRKDKGQPENKLVGVDWMM